MEKRYLVAFILSFLVLYTWSVIFPPPKPQHPQKTSQIIEKNDVKVNVAQTTESDTGVSFSEVTHYLENPKIRIEFTNRGGSIKSIYLKEFQKTLPVTNILSITDLQNQFFVEFQNDEKIVYISKEGSRQQIRKEFLISKNDYTVQSEIDVEKTEKSQKNLLFSLDVSRLDRKSHEFNVEKGLFEYFVYSEKDFFRKANAHNFNVKEEKSIPSLLKYVGFREKYFVFILKPLLENFENTSISVKNDAVLEIDSTGNAEKFNFILYYGPEERHILNNYGYEFEKVKKYYRLGLFDVTAKIIESLMFFIHRYIPSWGICIILLGTIIYFSMYPLTLRSMESMKKMQRLQPKIQALKEKHANNPQKMNKEMMELYQKEKINPFGGCLPVLLQMPVFIGLYQVLWRSVSLKNASFLWIKDLSAPDRLFLLKQHYPIIGNEINILPILMIVIMYFQQKASSKNMIITSPEQATQQKMMVVIMPFFLGFIFYKFASGLTIYFTVFYLFSAFTQWKMSKVT